MAATIKEIAKKAKVSIATVSRALNNDPKVKDETKKLIIKYSESLNYQPNLLARNFVKKTSNIIGLILPDISDEFFPEIMRSVDEVMLKNELYTMVGSSHKYKSLEETILAFERNGIIGGMIVLISSLTPKIKNIIKQSKIPIVLINGGSSGNGADIVSINNYQGSYDMTEFLIKKKGYRKLGFITGPKDNDDSNIRIKGFNDACLKNGIKKNDFNIVNGDFTKDSGFEGCSKLINLKNKPDVIFAANDMMALGCYEFMTKLGFKIPDHTAIVGFDDIFISKYLSPSLTTVRAQIDEVGKTAAELLIKRMKGGKIRGNSKIKIATELVIRNSC